MAGKLRLSKRRHTAVLELDNPPANTWERETLIQLRRFIEHLNDDEDICALILTGTGDSFFSAGAELRMFNHGNPEAARDIAEHFGNAFEALSRFKGVSISAINGYALGGGLECALACDIRIADPKSVLGLPEASVGLLPCAGGTQRLLSLIGEGWAKRLILCGEKLKAAQALSLGLIEELSPPDEAVNRAEALAEKTAQQSPQSLFACKKLIQQSRSQIQTGLALERDYFAELFGSHNQQEGVDAFLNKRKPQWKY